MGMNRRAKRSNQKTEGMPLWWVCVDTLLGAGLGVLAWVLQ